MQTHFATSQDVMELRHRLDSGFKDLDAKLALSEQRMTIKLGTIVSIAIGFAVTVVKLIT